MADTAGLFTREIPAIERYVQLGIAQGRVIAVDFPDTPEADADSDHELLDRIESYMRGTRDEFQDVTVALTMATDQAEVLEAVREVPYGENAVVEQITTMVPGRDTDDGDDLRAVREALAANPVPLFVPDHRVRDGPSGAPPAVVQHLRSVEGV